MAKGLNKHTPDSEELLKRLNTNYSSGLDDFEKEALEGFESLDNVDEAKRLTNSLNQKIDEKYFQKENKRRGFYYLSLAAGLVLVIGLSVFLFNYLGSEKKELALSNPVTTEQSVNEVAKPNDLAPPPSEEPKAEGKTETDSKITETTTADALAKSEKKFVASGSGGETNNGLSNYGSGKKDNWNSDSRAKSQPDADDGLTSRKIVKEKKPETLNEPAKLAEAKSGDDLKQSEDRSKLQGGPPAGNVNASPTIVSTTEKNKAKDEEAEMDADQKTVATKASANAPANSNSLASGKESKKSATKTERRNDKSSGEGVATDDVTTAKPETTVSGGVNQPKRDESGYYHATEFANRTYAKPQDYIKTEIDKSEMLKTNVKAFKAELTINEKGIVTAVKFLTDFSNCTGCKKELEKVLLNMPGWKAAQKGEKSVTETVSFIYP